MSANNCLTSLPPLIKLRLTSKNVKHFKYTPRLLYGLVQIDLGSFYLDFYLLTWAEAKLNIGSGQILILVQTIIFQNLKHINYILRDNFK